MANIVGGVTSINNPRTNWAQTDAKKADYLKNKPSVANALKGHKTGAIISADDVSPVEHELDIKVTDADGVPMGEVTVKRCGKNLTSIESVNLTGAEMRAVIYKGYLPKNFVLSWKQDFLATTPTQSALLSVKNLKTNESVYGVASWETYDWVMKFSHGDGEVEITILNWLKITGKLTQVQLEIGTTATDYEQYIEPVEATADAEGNVEGLMSMSPSMTLTTDNGGAVIECEYNRDANKVITDLETKLNTLIATIGG